MISSNSVAWVVAFVAIVLLLATAVLWGTLVRRTQKEPFHSWRHTLRLTRWSLYGIGLVVLLFAGTIAFTQAVLQPIQARTEALTANALPSVSALANARSGLVRLQTATRTHVLADEGTPARASSLADIASARHEVDESLAAYGRLPQFAGEHEHVVKVDAALALLDEHLTAALARPPVSHEARSDEIEALLPFVEAADVAVHELQLFNVNQAKAAASNIAASNAVSRATALGLSAFSIVTALIAGALVLRLGRKQARMAAEHDAVLTMRATELEAFAGRVAHDLKSPLGSLALRLAVMQRQGSEEERREHVDKAVRQVERMDHLIEGLLTFARAGANPPPNAHAQLRDAIDEVVEELRPAAHAAKTDLRVDPFPPREVACTPGALLSVLSNLLGNAVKYVVEGQEPARQVVVHVDDRGEKVRIEVADTGPGIPRDAEAHVFEPFWRVSGTRQPGVGLGLATVRRIVEAYGGHVGVRSSSGHGSVFWVELPRAQAA
jgi:signal transduction histidine kinase